jgi:hypothetical protein
MQNMWCHACSLSGGASGYGNGGPLGPLTGSHWSRLPRWDCAATAAAVVTATGYSLVHSELSWWEFKTSLHLHVAHTHNGSHYSVRSLIDCAFQ